MIAQIISVSILFVVLVNWIKQWEKGFSIPNLLLWMIITTMVAGFFLYDLIELFKTVILDLATQILK